MILPFSTKFKDGTPTNFIEKIWNCLIMSEKHEEYGDWLVKQTAGIPLNGNLDPKIHTIREDVNDCWRAGRMIHAVINNRSKNQFRFAPVFPCISTQKIEIKYTQLDKAFRQRQVFVDGKEISGVNIDMLAKNDGFASYKEFFAWFHEDYTGKIIHFTNLKY